MSTDSSKSYIGKIVSLISTASIRYEGTILMISNDKITLKNGMETWITIIYSQDIWY